MTRFPLSCVVLVTLAFLAQGQTPARTPQPTLVEPVPLPAEIKPKPPKQPTLAQPAPPQPSLVQPTPPGGTLTRPTPAPGTLAKPSDAPAALAPGATVPGSLSQPRSMD